ncbi:MAG: aminotransferase class III-fold pyridoxal phosphate-dependent enzyme, partial [Flavobacteriaceae bacterium]
MNITTDSITEINIEEWNGKQQWHPMGHPNDMLKKPPLIITKGKGVHIEDNKGNKMIDGVAGLWNINCGYDRPEIKEAIVKQLDELVYYSTFKGTSHPRSIELAHMLLKMMEPENMKRVMFSSGGSDAMETAMRIARQYWKIKGQKDRFKFISLKQGYHGTHFGAASVNGNTRFRRNYEPMLPGCFHVDCPWDYRNPYTEDAEELAKICAELVDRE